jgi:hypothetical protein
MRGRLAAVALALLVLTPLALAEWLQPDASYRDAQFLLRQAVRDTMGHGDDPARLDTLGVALLALGRFDEARAAFGKVLAAQPKDDAALAAFGKLALFADRASEAESLLSLAAAGPLPDPAVLNDLYAARLRQGRFAAAATLAPQVGEQGRVPLLEYLAGHPPYVVASGPDVAKAPWAKGYPVPLLRVKLGGQSVLMALDTGTNDLILDPTYARQADAKDIPARSLVFWDGARIAVEHAIVPRLELGGVVLRDLPAGVVGLRQWSQMINPRAEPIAGVIGLGVLRRFTPTIDYVKQTLELRKPGVPYPVGPGAHRIPFEIWGEADLTVYGSLNGGRRMALIVQSGLPACGVGAPLDVLSEIGVKPGKMSKVLKGAATVLQGAPWAGVTVPTVTVGPLVRTKVSGWAGALDDAELWRHGVRRDGILSHDFFKDQRVTIDWQKHELVVEGKH